jgi:hypothetical protein
MFSVPYILAFAYLPRVEIFTSEMGSYIVCLTLVVTNMMMIMLLSRWHSVKESNKILEGTQFESVNE